MSSPNEIEKRADVNDRVPPHELDDDQLAELAREWRSRAARGDELAFGLAHAFEAELRRRVRDSQVSPLATPEQPSSPEPRPWWKFW
ncbi:hypothetical protein LJR290_007352 [Variovorax sp. LjRoot290]|uniref:hypothetical protein n=1 Tax=unclassified Variovorax TaxID=663243 RepID=UPI003ECDF76C